MPPATPRAISKDYDWGEDRKTIDWRHGKSENLNEEMTERELPDEHVVNKDEKGEDEDFAPLTRVRAHTSIEPPLDLEVPLGGAETDTPPVRCKSDLAPIHRNKPRPESTERRHTVPKARNFDRTPISQEELEGCDKRFKKFVRNANKKKEIEKAGGLIWKEGILAFDKEYSEVWGGYRKMPDAGWDFDEEESNPDDITLETNGEREEAQTVDSLSLRAKLGRTLELWRYEWQFEEGRGKRGMVKNMIDVTWESGMKKRHAGVKVKVAEIRGSRTIEGSDDSQGGKEAIQVKDARWYSLFARRKSYKQ